MVVDGVELLRMMKNDELRDKDVYVTIHKDYIISSEEQRVKLQFSVDNRIALDEDFEELLNFNDLIEMEFEILSEEDEEIYIQAIEELTREIKRITADANNPHAYGMEIGTYDIIKMGDKINEIIKAIKQLDKKK